MSMEKFQMTAKIKKNEDVRHYVRAAYSQIAAAKTSCCGAAKNACGGVENPEQLARELGYAEAELSALPEDANMGLSCGNPTALAALKPGEVVLDLGSGGGFDVFIAAEKVGPAGKAIGVDMTHEMLANARKNIGEFTRRTGWNNVEFRLGEIEHLPIADHSVDVVISNCVINLSPDKAQVWKEIFRVLKPGGRAAISDLALVKPLPENMAESVAALVGCVAGAVLIADTEVMIKAAGFRSFDFDRKSGFIDKVAQWNDPLYRAIIDMLPKGEKLGSYITSLGISAVKPCCAPVTMDEKVQELIAVGAAVAAHCQPCFTYHLNKAKELGLSEDAIKAAVAVGESLQRGAAAAMHKHVRESLGDAIASSSCCRPETINN
jgi:AhpD family alkylhydroperoxidase